jgi:hypothetical protein
MTQEDKEKCTQLFLNIEEAIDAYISPDNIGYEDLFEERISYETGHEVKLSIKKIK